MPLHLHRSASNRALWNHFTDSFFAELGESPGPHFPTHAWLAHRAQRDLLLEEAERRGVQAWVGTPFSFLGNLPDRLGVEGRPAGLLTRRRLLGSIAAEAAGRHGIRSGALPEGSAIVRGHVLDPLIGELLPEAVEPDALRAALDEVAGDAFARRRNAWVVEVYERYRTALRTRGLFDPRAVPGLLAAAVADGRLADATGGAAELHLYGLHSLRTRRTLMAELARQTEVDVHTYLPPSTPEDEWRDLAASTELLDADRPVVRVQPAPDEQRETRWVAERVKRRIQDDAVEPRRIAVVSRRGTADTRRAWRALEQAGIPASARIQTPLSEVAALRFLLEMLRGAAEGWPYRILRNVVASPYVDCSAEPWLLDRLASERRIEGLGDWLDALASLRDSLLDRDEASEAQAAFASRVEESRRSIDALVDALGDLTEARDEAAWIRRTLELLDPGPLGFRRRLCRPVGDRWDVVRLDQRGVLQVETLLREWEDLGPADELVEVHAWHRTLSRLLDGHALTLSTPMQQGVQVLAAHDAALTPFDHVFVIHANDGVFPRPAGGGGVLTESERRRLRDVLPLSHRELELRRERTLWGAVTGADRVDVSYRTTDSAGHPLLPSLLVPEHEQTTELSRTWHLPEEPIDAREWLLTRARQTATEGAVRGSDPRVRAAVVHAVGEHQRERQGRIRDGVDLVPSPWSGHLRDPVVLEMLSQRFGDDHVWSAGRLEAYGTCPFLFLTQHVLRLQTLDEAEDETSPLSFGSIAHEVLELFYTRAGTPPPESFDAASEELLTSILQEVRARREAAGDWLGHPVLRNETFREISDAVRDHLVWELERLAEAGHVPVEMELYFGDDNRPVEVVSADLDDALVSLRLRGRIDRVDRVDRDGDADDPAYHIVDYKSSSVPTAGGYLDGSTLQAALYMSAYDTLTPGRCVKAGYRAIKNPRGRGSRCAASWNSEKHRTAVRLACSMPTRIRSGHFEPVRAAKNRKWASWDPGIEIIRGQPALTDGSRFEMGRRSPDAASREADRG